MGCYDLGQFQSLAKVKFGPKWAYHLRHIIIELGGQLASGLIIEQFNMLSDPRRPTTVPIASKAFSDILVSMSLPILCWGVSQ